MTEVRDQRSRYLLLRVGFGQPSRAKHAVTVNTVIITVRTDNIQSFPPLQSLSYGVRLLWLVEHPQGYSRNLYVSIIS